jgi:cold shock CspA family protein
MRHQGTVAFVSNKGWYFARDHATQSSVFVHQNEVENQRYLKVDDRIEFDLVPSTRDPAKTMAGNVKYLGHTIARQISDDTAVR